MRAIFAENGQKERINVIKNLSTYRKESEAVITHRCRGSLKASISIRYGKGWFEGNAWRMWRTVIDDEGITTVLTPIAKIRFCPFCGQKLEVPKEKTSDER